MTSFAKQNMNKLGHVLVFLFPIIFIIITYQLISNISYYCPGFMDPSYAYYLNMVRFYSDHTVGLVEHPGIPFQVFGGLILGAMEFVSSSGCRDHECYVSSLLENSEEYIRSLHTFFAILFSIALVVFGRVIFMVTKTIQIALLGQLFVCSMPITLFAGKSLSPEILLISLGLFIVSIFLLNISKNEIQNSHAFALGALIVTAIFTKLTAVSYAVISVIVYGKKNHKYFSVGLAATFLLWSIFIIEKGGIFFDFQARFAEKSGLYGYQSNEEDISTFLTKNMLDLYVNLNTEIISIIIVSIVSVLIFIKRKKIDFPIALVSCLCFVQLLLMLRQPIPRYFVPMVPLLAIVFVWCCQALFKFLHDTRRCYLLTIFLASIFLTQIYNNFLSLDKQIGLANDWVSRQASYANSIEEHYNCRTMRKTNRETALYFGKNWSRSVKINRLLHEVFPDFIIYNHNGRKELYNFIGALGPDEIKDLGNKAKADFCAIFIDRYMHWGLDKDFYQILEQRTFKNDGKDVSVTAVKVRPQ